VSALTGGIVDRLPEEKRRGMTIELGFSHFDTDGIRFSFIDVPGHERFVHTMLAGASGVDLALLVIAADDSVMPQTREHLALLQMLGVTRGVIAVTKCDLVDDDQLEMVHLEVAELIESTFLAKSAIINVSARTGLGIAGLQRALVEAVQSLPIRAAEDPRFRLPIDRVFSPSGTGTVVTGTVWQGTARVGDTLHLLPSAANVRIRRLQSQGADVDSIAAGQRAAINLVGVKASAISRGDELVTCNTFEAGRRHLVRIQCLSAAGHSLKHRDRVRIHLAANQVTAQLVMGDRREILPGEQGFAVIRCETPIVSDHFQPFVVRQLSPVETIGGGNVICPALRPADRLTRCLVAAEGLSDPDPTVRLAAYIDLCKEAEFDEAIQSRIGLSHAECETICGKLINRKLVVRVGGQPPRYVTVNRLDQLEQRMLKQCRVELDRRQPARQFPLAVVLSALSHDASPAVLDTVINRLVERGELLRRGDQIGLRIGPELTHRQRKLLDDLLAECVAAGRTPPVLKEYAERHGCTARDLEPLVERAVIEGFLVRLSPEFAIDHKAVEDLRSNLADYFRQHQSVTVSEIREHWGLTRKHAVPLLEFFDRQQITVRSGDVRTAGPRVSKPIDEVVS